MEIIIGNELAMEIPNFDGRYFITRSGKVFSKRRAVGGDVCYSMKATFGEPDRVDLRRNGNRFRPNVDTLIRRTFGDDRTHCTNGYLKWYLEEQYGLSSKEIDMIVEGKMVKKQHRVSTPNKLTEDDKKEIVRLYVETDMTQTEIGEAFGVSRQVANYTISKLLKDSRISISSARVDKLRNPNTSKIIKLRNEGATLEQIAEIFNLSHARVWKIVTG